MFDGLQILSNTTNMIKQQQTRCPNGTMFDGVWSLNISLLSRALLGNSGAIHVYLGCTSVYPSYYRSTIHRHRAHVTIGKHRCLPIIRRAYSSRGNNQQLIQSTFYRVSQTDCWKEESFHRHRANQPQRG